MNQSFIYVFLLLSIFFSKTIYTHDLPKVTAVLPRNGKLEKIEKASGISNWANIGEIYVEVSGKVEEILVEEGENVSKGQALFHLSFDKEEVHKKLSELEISKKKIHIDIEKINQNIKQIQEKIDGLKSEVFNQEKAEIKKEEENLQKLKILYQAGAISQEELSNIQYNLQKLYNTLAAKKEEHSKQLKAYQAELKSFNQDIKSKELDLKDLSIQEQTYLDILSKYEENKTIYAPQDATIISIPIKSGQKINENQLMMSFGVGTEYEIKCNVSLSNNFITVGDICELSNASYRVEGTVKKITPIENMKQITINFQSKENVMGETFDVLFQKESEKSYILVPNGAIHQDHEGYYLYQIKQRDGIMGKEYYVEKSKVYIGDSDDTNTVIVKGVNYFDPIAYLSDKPISEGVTVKVENEEDFLAN
ncbi:biotin/lipoyl-binding protein [Defluviitalea raffinosedens]|uniref:Biotin/lipoyl-binding protein n=1 Tax=Defluviitalea raffinosedens TaxID=1450156 RepID=A0A7C8HHM4_9FIRM|nr:biotin/lipoyl-binding protein [Defluviitalea raffinosedens]